MVFCRIQMMCVLKSVDPSNERINLGLADRMDLTRVKISSRMNRAEPRFLAVRYPRTLDGGVGESKRELYPFFNVVCVIVD